MWGARPRRTPAAAFRRRHGGAAGERSTGGLLSAEHTEFTWNQKTWEDKLSLKNNVRQTVRERLASLGLF